jgi:hypothetical protein
MLSVAFEAVRPSQNDVVGGDVGIGGVVVVGSGSSGGGGGSRSGGRGGSGGGGGGGGGSGSGSGLVNLAAFRLQHPPPLV